MRSRWDHDRLVTAMGAEDLGGGAMGYVMYLKHHHLIVTNDDAAMPKFGDDIVIGLYDGNYDDVREDGGLGSTEPVDQWYAELDEDDPDAQLAEFDRLIQEIEKTYG
jgi:hypothetical protein